MLHPKKTTLYTLNIESLIVKALKKIQHELMFYDADKIAREQTEMRIEIITEKGKIKAKAEFWLYHSVSR